MNNKCRRFKQAIDTYERKRHEDNVDALTYAYIYDDMKVTRDIFECQRLHNQPKKIIFNPPATIVIWEDGTKTVVKKQPDDIWDPEKSIALCFMKKFCGNNGNYNNIFKKFIKDGDENKDKDYDPEVMNKLIEDFHNNVAQIAKSAKDSCVVCSDCLHRDVCNLGRCNDQELIFCDDKLELSKIYNFILDQMRIARRAKNDS